MYISRVAFAGSDFAVIEEIGFAGRKADEHEAASADVSCGGLDDGKSKGDGYRCVNGIAAAFENFHARLRGERFVGGDHAVCGANGLAAAIPWGYRDGRGIRWRFAQRLEVERQIQRRISTAQTKY